MEYNNIIGSGNNYINLYNTGNLGVPIVCNIPFENKEKVLQEYGNQPNFLIEFTDFKYIMNWVVR